MKIRGLIAVLVISLIVGCNNNDDTPEVPTTGSITGEVMLYDEGTVNLGGDGMSVIVEGSNPLNIATTNSSGSFTLENVPFGTYTLSYEKAEYGTFKKFNVTVSEDSINVFIEDTPSLGQLSSTTIVDLAVEVSGDEVMIFATTEPAGNVSNIRYLRFFLRDRENVSSTRYDFFSQTIAAGNNPVTYTITKDQLIRLGFVEGSTVYVIAYGDSFWSNDYLDPNESRFVFPNLNPTTSGEVSFEVP